MSTLVAMMVGSKNSTLPLVKTSVETILKNGGEDVVLLIGVSHNTKPEIETYLWALIQWNHKVRVTRFIGTWAEFMNVAAKVADDTGCDWLIESHDDVEILTPNLVQKVEDAIGDKKDQIGWISFLDKDYLRGHWAPSVREGFAIDAVKENAWSRKKTHQFHSLPENWWSLNNTRQYLESLPYDIPNRPVKCHAPFSHFIMIKTETLRSKIGDCPNWSPVSLLIDEDRGLTALSRGLFNIWIPQIEYIHVRAVGTRAADQIKEFGPDVHKKFEQKWGFPHKGVYSDAELNTIGNRFVGTNVPWSMSRCTYEWDYL